MSENPFPEYVKLQENRGDIYRDFSEGVLTLRDAIVHLQKIGQTRTKPSGLSTNGPNYSGDPGARRGRARLRRRRGARNRQQALARRPQPIGRAAAPTATGPPDLDSLIG